MNIKILNINDREQVSSFCEIKNEAYKARSCKHIPYVERSEKDLKEKLSIGQSFVVGAYEGEGIIGGIGCRYLMEEGVKIAELFWFFTSVEFQKRGIAQQLLSYVEEKMKVDNVHIVRLNVLKAATAAISLYKKNGFKPFKVWAYTEGTSCYIQYAKTIQPVKGWTKKRLCTFFLSQLKYWILFKKDNSPTLVHKMIFNEWRKKA